MNSTKKRLVFYACIFVSIGVIAFFVIKIAQGYRPNLIKKTIEPTGLLVATSIPDGAQLFIDGKLVSATNNTLNLPPGEYNIEVKKDGYSPWEKRLVVKRELVTKADATLFSTYPNLEALTFTGANNPVLSPDGQHVVFGVATASASKRGVWVLDLTDRLLGLSREPRQLLISPAKGRDFSQYTYSWSPDSKQILLTKKYEKTYEENLLIDASQQTADKTLIDVTKNLPDTEKRWSEDEKVRQEAKLSKLPEPLLTTLTENAKDISFSLDETKILYTATASATIADSLLPTLPTTSTQKEKRSIEKGEIYVYDLKEDKNFFISKEDKSKSISWFPTSRHLFIVENDKVQIAEYDGTNWVDVYSGPFENHFAFPFPSGNRIIILTSIGQANPPNLYAISLR